MEVRSIDGLVQVKRGAEKITLLEGAFLEKNDVLLVGPESSVFVQDQFGKVVLFEENSQVAVNDLVDSAGLEPLNLQAEESMLLAQTTEAAHSNFLGLESLAGVAGGLSGGTGSLIAAGGATAAGAFVVSSVTESNDEALTVSSELSQIEPELTTDERFQLENPDVSPNSPVAISDVIGALANGADTTPEGTPPFDNVGDIVSTVLYGRDPGDIEGVGGLLVGLGDAVELTFGDIPVLQEVTGTLASIIRNESPENSPIADLFSLGFKGAGFEEGFSAISSSTGDSPLSALTDILPKLD